MNDAPQEPARNVPAVRGKPFAAGDDARRGTAGGRPKTLKAIEVMLDKEHRNLAAMTKLFAELRVLALRGDKGDAAYMKLYLERVMGPVKDLDVGEAFKDAPPEVLKWAVDNLH